MEIARLVLDFLKVLVWPAVVVAVAFGFREEFRGLLRRMKLLSAVGVDAQFSEAVERASVEAEAAVTQSEPQSGEPIGSASPATAEEELRSPRFYLNPTSAMMDAWQEVRHVLNQMIREHTGYARVGISVLRRFLWSDSFLSAEIAQSLRNLFEISEELRYTGRRPTNVAASEYIEGCEAMTAWLREYRRSPAWSAIASSLEGSASRA
ncbi:hypothetical protein ACOZGD_03650 [Streptomyces murinus]